MQLYVFSIMHSYFKTFGKYLLFIKYLTSTNMPTAYVLELINTTKSNKW